MKKTELIFRTLFGFLFISLIWLLYSITDYVNGDLISLSDLKEVSIKSLIKGILLSLPFGIWKYIQIEKSQKIK